MKKLIAISIISASVPAFAGSYQSELNAGYGSGEAEFGDFSNDVSAWYVSGEYYLSKVGTDKGPLDEAAFLSKSSSVFAGVSRNTVEGEDGEDDENLDLGVLGVHVVSSEDWIGDISYAYLNDVDSPLSAHNFNMGVGKYLDDRHAVMFSYDLELYNNAGNLDKVETYDASYHGFMAFGGGAAMSYDASLQYVQAHYSETPDEDDGIGISAGATYYPMKELGIGVSLGQQDVGDVTTTTYGVNAKYFFSESVAASLAYSFDEVDNDNLDDTIDTDVISVGVTARF